MSIQEKVSPEGIVAVTMIGMAQDKGWIKGPWTIQTEALRVECPLHLPEKERSIKFALGLVGEMNKLSNAGNDALLEQFGLMGELFGACYDELAAS